MKESTYLCLRRIFYWIIFFVFVILMPVIIYNSIGYKFDKDSRHFLKTGLISVKTYPRGASVIMNNKRLPETTPCILREVLPRAYSVILEKEGYYPYQIEIVVRPSKVSELDAMLVPKMKNVEKLSLDFEIYRFFILKHFMGETIIAFTDNGIYSFDNDFKNSKKLSGVDFGNQVVADIHDLIENNNRLIFWNKNNIWIINLSEIPEITEDVEVLPFYKSEEALKEVFLGLKERYLIVHDGLKIFALDIQNPSSFFLIYTVKSPQSAMYYEMRTETIYIKDKVPQTDSFSLYRMELIPLINERQVHEKNP